ncbi:L,D-transpeptidase [Actinokineospora spheciospongiae]|uniref:L,D-transpeptidase n=1 Tax=Actinokineospora spheciospongiae TaxID=909613 RepID=UPI0009FC937A|nr:Ig-like domain-containing protein [Actinokineospora spheciospongiae]PWW56238.1 peptidoglycan transpeptidase precursor (ErfK-YbiS-YhnG family) [Actinokineospora spheciospongiae]
MTRGRWARAVLACVGVVAVAACTAEGSATPGGTPPEAVAAGARSTAPPVPLALALAPADQAAGVAPGAPVTVTAAGGKITEAAVTGADGKVVAGALSADGTSWTTTEALGYGKTYTATATAADPAGRTATSTSTFTTVKPARQTALSMNPLDGQVVGVGQPFAFYFDAAVADKAAAEKAITVTPTPAAEGAFYWFSDKEVHWRPKEYLKAHSTVTINAAIYGKDLGNGVYGRADRTATVTVGDSVIAVADGTTHQMTVTVNGTPARTIPISLGKKAHETPVGTYTVMSEHTDYTMDSSTYGVPTDSAAGYRTEVEVASRMSNSGIFFHSAPWSVRDQGVRNVSHGCINMSTENAAWLQSISNKGDVIVVQNSGGPVLEAWDGQSDWQIPWETWKAGGKR